MVDAHIQSAVPPPELPKVLVTAGPEAPPEGSIVITSPGVPDREVIVSRWWVQVGVRVARTYLQSLLGFIMILGSDRLADAVGIRIEVTDFSTLMIQAGSLSVAPAAIALLQNCIELLARLDMSNPKLRA